jgi:SAM-dependent methyltransferase
LQPESRKDHFHENLVAVPNERLAEIAEAGLLRSHYAAKVPRRHLDRETLETNTIVFNDTAASLINKARIDHLASLDLAIEGKRVLDVGCGVGHFTDFYTRKGCSVVGIDARYENIEEMAERYPTIEGHVADVQSFPLSRFGQFDVIHCYGLLYHLENPVAALRNISVVCDDLLILETIICDSSLPVLVAADEALQANQAISGIGSRPSPSFVAMALNRVGFPYVYMTLTLPDHPDFHFEWQNDFSTTRGKNNMRCVFVASRTPQASRSLLSLLS